MKAWRKRSTQIVFIILLAITGEIFMSGLVPKPSAIVSTLERQLSSIQIWENLFRTAYRAYLSSLLALFVGVGIGVVDYFSETASSITNMIFYPTQFVSEAVLTLIAIAVIGIDPSVIYIVTVLAIAPDVFVVTQVGLENIDMSLLELGDVYNSSSLSSLRHLVIPQLLPYIFGGLVRAHATAWDIVATVEVFLALDGLGYLVQNEFRLLNLPELFSLVILIVLAGLTSDYILHRIKSKIDEKYMSGELRGGLIE